MVAIGARKQVELGASGVLFVVKSFNVVAVGARRQEELKWEPEGKFPSPLPFFFLCSEEDDNNTIIMSSSSSSLAL
jgi:hypothetical protein